MKNVLALCLVFFFNNAISSVVYTDGNELFSKLKESDGYDRGYAAGFVIGITDYLSANGKICITKQVSVRQIIDISVKYLESHPEVRHYSANSIAEVALISAFPCKKSK